MVVNIAQQLDNPPDTMREYLKSLWKNQLTYQRDQYVYRQQREADERRREQTLRRYQRCVTRWLIGLCLLYTSDAADDLPCVDLGGRRIIKKKH